MQETHNLLFWCEAILASQDQRTAIQFIPRNSEPRMSAELTSAQAAIDRLQTLLDSHGEGYEQAIEYARRGAFFKRDAAMEGARKYLETVPEFWHERLMQDAMDSVDTQYYDAVSRALSALNCNLEKDVLVAENGRWMLSDERKEQIRATYVYSATGEDIEAVRLMRDLLKAADALHKHEIFLNAGGGRADFLTDILDLRIDSMRDAIELIQSYIQPSESELAAMRARYAPMR